jgi:hypothetical protein
MQTHFINYQQLRMQPLSILPLQSINDNESQDGGVAFIPLSYFEALFYGNIDMGLNILACSITSELTNRSIAIKCMPHDEYDDCVFLPDWSYSYLGQGTVRINKIDFDATPVAHTIRARVVDNEAYHSDIKEELENLLSSFKFIQANIVLTIADGSQIWIEDVLDEEGSSYDGPAQLGEEVRLDMGEPLERAPEFEEPVSVPEPEPEPEPEPVPEPELSAEERARIAREARLKRFA